MRRTHLTVCTYFYFILYREKIDDNNLPAAKGEKGIFPKGLMVLAKPVSQELSTMTRWTSQNSVSSLLTRVNYMQRALPRFPLQNVGIETLYLTGISRIGSGTNCTFSSRI